MALFKAAVFMKPAHYAGVTCSYYHALLGLGLYSVVIAAMQLPVGQVVVAP